MCDDRRPAAHHPRRPQRGHGQPAVRMQRPHRGCQRGLHRLDAFTHPPGRLAASGELMQVDSAAVGLLIIILLIVGANFVMYVIARGATRGGNSRWMSALKDSLSKPMKTPASQSMDELRKRVEELEKPRDKQ